MTSQIERAGDFCAFILSGRIEPADADQLQAQVNAQCDDAVKWLLFDLAGVDYIGSVGLRVFVSAAKRARANGGEARLSGLSGAVKHVFEITQVNKLLHTFPTRFDAMKTSRPHPTR